MQTQSNRISEKTEEYPLSPYERGMYIEQRLDTSSTVYNLNIMAMIRGKPITAASPDLSGLRVNPKAHNHFYTFQHYFSP